MRERQRRANKSLELARCWLAEELSGFAVGRKHDEKDFRKCQLRLLPLTPLMDDALPSWPTRRGQQVGASGSLLHLSDTRTRKRTSGRLVVDVAVVGEINTSRPARIVVKTARCIRSQWLATDKGNTQQSSLQHNTRQVYSNRKRKSRASFSLSLSLSTTCCSFVRIESHLLWLLLFFARSFSRRAAAQVLLLLCSALL